MLKLVHSLFYHINRCPTREQVNLRTFKLLFRFAHMSRHDVFIIGGGPIGLACGIAAQKADLNYIIVEKGCLINSLYNYPVNMTFFSTPESAGRPGNNRLYKKWF